MLEPRGVIGKGVEPGAGGREVAVDKTGEPEDPSGRCDGRGLACWLGNRGGAQRRKAELGRTAF